MLGILIVIGACFLVAIAYDIVEVIKRRRR